MKAAFTVDNTPYLFEKEGERTIHLYRVEGFKKPVLIATFPTWKKQDWFDDGVSDELRVRLFNVVDGFRRVTQFAKAGVVLQETALEDLLSTCRNEMTWIRSSTKSFLASRWKGLQLLFPTQKKP